MVSRGSQRERDLDLDDWFAETDFASHDIAHRRPSRPVVREDDTRRTVRRRAGSRRLARSFGRARRRAVSPEPRRSEEPETLARARRRRRAHRDRAVRRRRFRREQASGGSADDAGGPDTDDRRVDQDDPEGHEEGRAPGAPRARAAPRAGRRRARGETPGSCCRRRRSSRANSGVQVKRLQQALAAVGYSPGKIDGHYGPATKQRSRSSRRPRS